MSPRLLAAALAGALAVPGPIRADAGPFVRFRGGGPATTDCMLVTEVAGATGVRAPHCTDGDPACDDDGVADGVCRFRVRVCLDAVDDSMPRCHADVVTGATVTSKATTAVAPLKAAVASLPSPVIADTCTAPIVVPVARRARASGRVVLRARAVMASGHADRDRVVLRCEPPAVGGTTTFATLQRKIFTPSCALASCHGAAAAGGLALGADVAYDDLVGVPATNPAAQAAGVVRVVPGDPAASFLVRKLEGDLAPGEGDRMPQVGAALPAKQLDLVRRWITAGAPATAGF